MISVFTERALLRKVKLGDSFSPQKTTIVIIEKGSISIKSNELIHHYKKGNLGMIIPNNVYIVNPIFAGISLVVMTALSFIFAGIVSIVLAFQLKKLKTFPERINKELKEKIEHLKEEYYKNIQSEDK